MQQDQLDARSTSTLVEEFADLVDEVVGVSKGASSLEKRANISDSKIEQVINSLLDEGWTERQLKRLINKTGMKPKEFFKILAQKVKAEGVNEAIEFIKKKSVPASEKATVAPAGAPLEIPKASPIPQGPTSPPTPQGTPATKVSNTDVDLMRNLKGENLMSTNPNTKIVVKNGELVEAPIETANGLENLMQAIRETKVAMRDVEEKKVKCFSAKDQNRR
jgi:flagellar basal body P-ring protein FlgI